MLSNAINYNLNAQNKMMHDGIMLQDLKCDSLFENKMLRHYESFLCKFLC